MPDMTPAPRRRPLWRLFIMPALLVVAAAAWSAFWFYAASEVGVRADAWAAQEAKSGRVYACGKRSVAGFPFRFEVRCDDASVVAGLADGGRAGAVHRAARRNHGDRADLPAETADRRIQGAGHAGRSRPAAVAEGELDHAAAAACSGLPDIPQRASIVFDNPSIDRVNGPVADAARARQPCRTARPPRRRLGAGSIPSSKPCCRYRAAACRKCTRCWLRRSMSTFRPG